MGQDVHVVGVGMIAFAKPGAHAPYPQMAAQAVQAALHDAGLSYADLQQAYVGLFMATPRPDNARSTR